MEVERTLKACPLGAYGIGISSCWYRQRTVTWSPASMRGYAQSAPAATSHPNRATMLSSTTSSITSNRVAPASAAINHAALRLRGALSRALMMAGALEKALALATRYATERSQFGRKIGQFQAIQQELARFAGEVAAAVAAALSAAGALERGEDALLPIAAAKIRTAQAAHEGAMIAHQVHGAIGVTDAVRAASFDAALVVVA